MSDASGSWHEANQRYLLAALAVVGEALDFHASSAEAPGPRALFTPSAAALQVLKEQERALPEPAALQTLCALFHLSPFERDVLLLCAGVELDSEFAARCSRASGSSSRAAPTFSLALASLPEPHWSALSPSGPLRRFRLVTLEPGAVMTSSRLRIDERALHYLTGIISMDERLHGMVEFIPPGEELAPTHAATAQRMARQWASVDPENPQPVLMLCGPDESAKTAVASAACASLGLRLHGVRAADLPTSPSDREVFCRLWERESALGQSALLIECDDTDPADATRAAAMMADRLGGLLLLATRDPLRVRRRTVVRFDIHHPPPAEQEALWKVALGELQGELNGQLQRVVSQFNLGARGIQAVSMQLQHRLEEEGSDTAGMLWDICRTQARPRLDDLAQRIDATARWKELVLPQPQMEMLRALAAHVRQRARVYEAWGFAEKGARGLGISALFSGASGTGKTMAAEVLARELRLDLYRIDLSHVVSKYIGETEKNLRRIFDAAEEGGALLLFDEADALFGKRTEVKDSHDRYANLEVSYLLQRMESHRGLAILTTNLRSALDTAFVRRLRFIVEFPFPSQEQRAEIWQRIFPANTPTEGLDPQRLARLSVA